MSALNQRSAAELVAMLAGREISAEQLTRACLDRIEQRESEVQAWQYIDENHAIAQAREIDRAPRAPLYGLPIGIKDIIDTSDLPTEYGCSLYRNHQPTADAACVAALRKAGGVILGKTVTTELAYFTPGKTRNPHRLAHTPGGSSSGSAAAVADQMVPIALGTQTAGSIIRPASFCGVIGYKPTFGQFPMAQIKQLAASLDTLGFFARATKDLPLLCEALTGRPWQVPGLEHPLRIAYCHTEQWPMASLDVQQVLSRAADQLRAAGASVEPIELEEPFRGLLEAQKVVMAVEMSRALRAERERYGDRLGPELRMLFAEADALPAARYDTALQQADECRRRMGPIFEKFDLLLTPSAPGEAPAGLGNTGDPVFNRIWTLLHLPCISVPVGRGSTGLPIGVQLVGAAHRDAKLLAAAEWVFSTLS